MKSRQFTGFALLALGLGVATNAILGPLVLGVIEFRVSDNAEGQLVGGELISLLLAAPVAVAAGVLWLRGHRLAPPLALGPALYAVYTYVQLIVGPEYERYDGNNEYAFPLYLALIILSWAIAVQAWTALGAAPLPPPPAGLRRALAGLLVVPSLIFALAWAAGVVDVLDGGAVGQAYREDTTLFWLVKLMDLAFVIPAALTAGVGLLRRAPWATRLGYACAGFLTLEVGAVAGMAAVMALRDDPSASAVLLAVSVAIALSLATVTALLLRDARQAARGPARQDRAAQGWHPRRGAYPRG